MPPSCNGPQNIQLEPYTKSESPRHFAEEASSETRSEKFIICQFVIDIVEVSVKGLIAMRRVLPRQEYRLIKNRKCARVSRRKRKE
jgi:hypothetical protein